MSSKFFKIYVIIFSFLSLASTASAQTRLDALLQLTDTFSMNGQYIQSDTSKPPQFQLEVTLSETNRKTYLADKPYSAFEKFYNAEKSKKSLPLGISFRRLLDLKTSQFTHLNSILAGQIIDSQVNSVMPQSIAEIDGAPPNVTFMAWKKKDLIGVRISIKKAERALVIRRGFGKSFSLALVDALTNKDTVARSKLDAIIEMNDQFFLFSGQGDDHQFKLQVRVSMPQSPTQTATQLYIDHDLQSVLVRIGSAILTAEPDLLLPIQFKEWLQLDMAITGELQQLIKDRSREQYLISIVKDINQDGDHLVQFKIFLDNADATVIKTGSGFTLSQAIKAAFPARNAVMKSKIDEAIRLSNHFYMHGGYSLANPSRAEKVSPFIIQLNSDFGRMASQGVNFEDTLTKLFDSLSQSELGKKFSNQFNFKNLIALNADELQAFEDLLKDEYFHESVIFTLEKNKNNQVQLRIEIGDQTDPMEASLTRESIGPHLSATIQKILEARNVIGVGKEYIAISSADLENHYDYYYKSELERESSRSYQIYLNSNPDATHLVSDHPGTFIHLSAEQYCRHHRYQYLSGIPITKPTFTTYSPATHAGKAFIISYNMFEPITEELSPARWRLSPENMKKVKSSAFLQSAGNTPLCPHIVFLELYCSHGL